MCARREQSPAFQNLSSVEKGTVRKRDIQIATQPPVGIKQQRLMAFHDFDFTLLASAQGRKEERLTSWLRNGVSPRSHQRFRSRVHEPAVSQNGLHRPGLHSYRGETRKGRRIAGAAEAKSSKADTPVVEAGKRVFKGQMPEFNGKTCLRPAAYA